MYSTTTRSLTEFVRSAIVLDEIRLAQVAQGTFDVRQLVQGNRVPDTDCTHSSNEPTKIRQQEAQVSQPPETVVGSPATRVHRLHRIAELAKALAAEHDALKQHDRRSAALDDDCSEGLLEGGRRRMHSHEAPIGQGFSEIEGNQPTLARSFSSAMGVMRRMLSSSSLVHEQVPARSSAEASLLHNELSSLSRNNSTLLGAREDSSQPVDPHATAPLPERAGPLVGSTPSRRLRSTTLLGESVHLHAHGASTSSPEPSVVLRADGFVYIPDR
jgi:hypothetical protein